MGIIDCHKSLAEEAKNRCCRDKRLATAWRPKLGDVLLGG